MTVDKHTILYAEDDLDDLFMVRQAFEAHDHIHVEHAPDGRVAMQMLEGMLERRHLPCLVILDINMPAMNGREVLEAIRNHPQLTKLAVALFSTSSSPSDAEFARRLDAIFITKPIDYTDLEQIALRFVDRCNFEVNKLEVE